MEKPSSSSSSKRSWIWVIEALASYKEYPIRTLQALIDAAPVTHQDFSENAMEFIALRCLEELASYDTSSSSSSTLDSSLTCLDVVHQILDQVPLSNLNRSSFEAVCPKWDLNQFIMHKRASQMKCHLEKMKDSILDGTLQLPDKLKEMSGLFPKNPANMASVNQGKRHRLEHIHTRCTTSKRYQSSGQHKVINTTLKPQHTCEGETNHTVHVDPILLNDGNTNNNQHMTNQSQPQPQQKKPNVASSNVSQKPVASDKGVVDTVSEAELSSDSDMYHNEEIALTAKKDEFLRSRHAFGQDLPAMTESTGQNLCIKCNEAGQLLFCQTSTCSLMMHKYCLGDSDQLDANGNFLCPFCEYSRTISEYLEAKKSTSLSKEQLAIFKSKGKRN